MMLKNKIWAMSLALALAAAPFGGSGLSVFAAEADGAIAQAEENVTLPAPTGVTWRENYISQVNPIDGATRLEVEVYKNGESMPNLHRNYFQHSNLWGGGGSVFGTALSELNETGEYYFRVRWVQGEGAEQEVSPWAESGPINYVRPDKQIGTTVAYWDDETAGTVSFSKVENAGGHDVKLYKLDETTGEWEQVGRIIGYVTGRQIQAVSMTRYIDRYGAGKYCVSVTALSADVDQWAHGAEGPMSAVYDTTVTASDLKEILSNAMASGNAASAVTALTGAADISAIRMSMQTDVEFRNLVQQLEKKYNDENGITTGIAVSEQAKEAVGSGAVEIVGAGFNGSGQVTLEVDMASPEKQIPVYSGYSNPVQLDIKLSGVSGDSLKMPVTITMPIPGGINGGSLIILHSHSDGTIEGVKYHNNGNGTVTFTVPDFSTFVFAQAGSANSGSSDSSSADQTESEGDAQEDSSVSDGMSVYEEAIAMAAPGAVITIPKSDGVDAISNGVMRMLYERKDVTLVMEYTYEGVDYRIVIPAGGAVYTDIPWYGPLYLAAHYGNGAVPVGGTSGNYVIKSGDTLGKIAQANGLTLSQLAAMNPQIQDVNKIWAGQKITVK